MNKKPFLTIFTLTSAIITSLFFSLIVFQPPYQGSPNSTVLGQKTSSADPITVSASIGEYRFTLFGYTSPNSLVSFQGLGIYDQTFSDKSGYFEFKNRFSPFSPREACLTSKDQFGRLTSPVCLPPFPTHYNVSIGPVIMPPTESFNPPAGGDYFIGDEVILSGQTIPNTEVDLSMFANTTNRKTIQAFLPNLVKPIYASQPNKTIKSGFAFPLLQTKSDKDGNFSIALPSSSSKTFRLFTNTNFKNQSSPKGITLNLKILPIWMIFIKIFLLLLSVIKSRLIEIVVLGEIMAISYYLYRRYFHPHSISKNKAMVVRKKYALMKKKE